VAGLRQDGAVDQTPADDGDPQRLTLADFPVQWPVTTRWADNDMFGHLNNAVYYELFDTAINGWLTAETGTDPVTAPTPGVVAESGCRFFSELAFPDPLVVALRVIRLGRSSVTYQLGLFGQGARSSPAAAAVGHFVHVYIDRETRRPMPIPDHLRAAMAKAGVTRG
jgi:acyl-CoA thioester hydrolase